MPRGAGVAASLFLILASGLYGALKGDHLPVVVTHMKDARDAVANAAGFGIQSLSIVGRRNLSERDLLVVAGVNERTSLLFFDVEEARLRLKSSPWVATAAVRKFYPGHLQIEIEERDVFALWQKDGKLSVIAADGAVLAPYHRSFSKLPLVVGRGAAVRAKEFLLVLARYPIIRDQVTAAVLIAERRWNLRLKNGMDIRLPELDVDTALDRLAKLERDKAVLTRDITAVDLRLPDRVGVRLSEAAAQAREDALKPKKPKKKATDA